jgi:hypothetical protein
MSSRSARQAIGKDVPVEQHLEISGWLRWLTAEEGGRNHPHPGGRYAATAFWGVLSGKIGHDSGPAELHTREHAAIPVTVSLEFARAGGHDRAALLIHDTGVSTPPPGALLRPRIVSPADWPDL